MSDQPIQRSSLWILVYPVFEFLYIPLTAALLMYRYYDGYSSVADLFLASLGFTVAGLFPLITTCVVTLMVSHYFFRIKREQNAWMPMIASALLTPLLSLIIARQLFNVLTNASHAATQYISQAWIGGAIVFPFLPIGSAIIGLVVGIIITSVAHLFRSSVAIAWILMIVAVSSLQFSYSLGKQSYAQAIILKASRQDLELELKRLGVSITPSSQGNATTSRSAQ